jgi:hypothetical protein
LVCARGFFSALRCARADGMRNLHFCSFNGTTEGRAVTLVSLWIRFVAGTIRLCRHLRGSRIVGAPCPRASAPGLGSFAPPGLVHRGLHTNTVGSSQEISPAILRSISTSAEARFKTTIRGHKWPLFHHFFALKRKEERFSDFTAGINAHSTPSLLSCSGQALLHPVCTASLSEKRVFA